MRFGEDIAGESIVHQLSSNQERFGPQEDQLAWSPRTIVEVNRDAKDKARTRCDIPSRLLEENHK